MYWQTGYLSCNFLPAQIFQVPNISIYSSVWTGSMFVLSLRNVCFVWLFVARWTGLLSQLQLLQDVMEKDSRRSKKMLLFAPDITKHHPYRPKNGWTCYHEFQHHFIKPCHVSSPMFLHRCVWPCSTLSPLFFLVY